MDVPVPGGLTTSMCPPERLDAIFQANKTDPLWASASSDTVVANRQIEVVIIGSRGQGDSEA